MVQAVHKWSVIPVDPDTKFLSEEEAARFWQRAAQLQAEAARKAEAARAAEALADVANDGEAPEGEQAAVDAPGGYALAHVRSAALEVGIGSEFVDAALADLRAERALPQRKRRLLTRWLLRDAPETITARRVIEASPEDVRSAMEATFPHEPYRLTLTDRRGDPLDGGVLVFDIQGLNSPIPQGFALEAKYGGMRQVLVSLRSIQGATPSCEVTLRGPVAGQNTIQLAQGGIFTGIAGGIGVVAMVMLSAALGLGPVAAVLGAAVGTVAGGGLGVKAYRASYRYGTRRAGRALDGLLGALAGRAEGGWGMPPLGDGKPPLQPPGSSNPTG